MSRAALAMLVLLAACNTPGQRPGYPPPAVLAVEGSMFRVFHDGRSAVAIRIDPDLKPRAGRIFARAALAMEQASGCRVVRATLAGDVTMIRADLLCP